MVQIINGVRGELGSDVGLDKLYQIRDDLLAEFKEAIDTSSNNTQLLEDCAKIIAALSVRSRESMQENLIKVMDALDINPQLNSILIEIERLISSGDVGLLYDNQGDESQHEQIRSIKSVSVPEHITKVASNYNTYCEPIDNFYKLIEESSIESGNSLNSLQSAVKNMLKKGITKADAGRLISKLKLAKERKPQTGDVYELLSTALQRIAGAVELTEESINNVKERYSNFLAIQAKIDSYLSDDAAYLAANEATIGVTQEEVNLLLLPVRPGESKAAVSAMQDRIKSNIDKVLEKAWGWKFAYNLVWSSLCDDREGFKTRQQCDIFEAKAAISEAIIKLSSVKAEPDNINHEFLSLGQIGKIKDSLHLKNEDVSIKDDLEQLTQKVLAVFSNIEHIHLADTVFKYTKTFLDNFASPEKIAQINQVLNAARFLEAVKTDKGYVGLRQHFEQAKQDLNSPLNSGLRDELLAQHTNKVRLTKLYSQDGKITAETSFEYIKSLLKDNQDIHDDGTADRKQYLAELVDKLVKHFLNIQYHGTEEDARKADDLFINRYDAILNDITTNGVPKCGLEFYSQVVRRLGTAEQYSYFQARRFLLLSNTENRHEAVKRGRQVETDINGLKTHANSVANHFRRIQALGDASQKQVLGEQLNSMFETFLTKKERCKFGDSPSVPCSSAFVSLLLEELGTDLQKRRNVAFNARHEFEYGQLNRLRTCVFNLKNERNRVYNLTASDIVRYIATDDAGNSRLLDFIKHEFEHIADIPEVVRNCFSSFDNLFKSARYIPNKVTTKAELISEVSNCFEKTLRERVEQLSKTCTQEFNYPGDESAHEMTQELNNKKQPSGKA